VPATIVSSRQFNDDASGAQRARRNLFVSAITILDANIAATTLVHRMTVVTRNGSDFASTGVPLLNPWDSVSKPGGLQRP
jgi:predicted nucleic acid-binding protein